MRRIIKVVIFAQAIVAGVFGQASGKIEFEVSSIKPNAPQSGFHFAADSASGGPGTADPGMFRCSKCSLSTLIMRAFSLQPYQFPSRKSYTDTFEVMAKVPEGTTGEEFTAMLQNLLKERFGLAWHFEEKRMKGYQLVVAKNGPKLKESTEAPRSRSGDAHRNGLAETHSHSGAIVVGSSAAYRANNQTIADLARVLSDQIGLPVEDSTGLSGKYDISLRWSGGTASQPGNHTEGGYSGGAGHAGHEGSGGAGAGSADSSGPSLSSALQEQLGLKLAAAEQSMAHLFVVDHVAHRPTEN